MSIEESGLTPEEWAQVRLELRDIHFIGAEVGVGVDVEVDVEVE